MLLALVSALVLCLVAFPIFLARRRGIEGAAKPVATGEPAWAESGLQTIETADFELFRVVPSGGSSAAAFAILDFDGKTSGTLTFADQVRASLLWNGASYEKFSQSSGIFKSPFAGKVGGTSDRSIVVRRTDRVAAEIFPQRAGLGFDYRIVAAELTYVAKSDQPIAVIDTSIHRVELDSELVAAYRRLSPATAFVALAPGLNEDVAAAVLFVVKLT